jgi:hypothetical protein
MHYSKFINTLFKIILVIVICFIVYYLLKSKTQNIEKFEDPSVQDVITLILNDLSTFYSRALLNWHLLLLEGSSFFIKIAFDFHQNFVTMIN